MKYLFCTILMVFAGWAWNNLAMAYVASSTNYQIERDSINFAGVRSTSTNYVLEDTAGESATGKGTSTNYTLLAGYQQTDPSISINSPSDVTLLPTIISLTGGSATGTASWTVITDNPAGYTLSIKAASSPALNSGGNSFANYTVAGVNPDYTWSVGGATSEFGFTPEGSDIASAYKDDGGTCATGSLDTTAACWDSVTSSNKTIGQRASPNGPDGIVTTVRFQAEAGAVANQASGSYVAVITLTATAL